MTKEKNMEFLVFFGVPFGGDMFPRVLVGLPLARRPLISANANACAYKDDDKRFRKSRHSMTR